MAEGEATGRPGGGRFDVDRLVSDLVDEQLGERRELNRLITGVHEDLSRVQSALGELVDKVEDDQVREATARLRTGVEELTREMVELRRTSAEQGDRLLELGRAVRDVLAELDERQKHVVEDLVRIERRVEALAEHPAEERVAEVVGRIDGIVAGLADQVGPAVQDRLEPLLRTVERTGGATARIEDQAAGLRREIGDIRQALDAIEVPTQPDTEAVAGAVSERLRGRLDTMQDRLGVLEAHLEDHTRALASLADTTSELSSREGAGPEAAAAAVQQQLDDRLFELEKEMVGPLLEERLDQLQARLGEALNEEVGRTFETVREAATDIAGSVSQVEDMIEEAGQRGSQAVARQLREQLLERIDDRTSRIVGDLRVAIREELVATRDSVEEELDAAHDRQVLLRDEVERRLNELADQIEARIDESIGTTVSELRASVTRLLDDTSERVEDAETSLNEVMRQLTALAPEFDAAAAQAVDAAIGTARREARGATRELRETGRRLDDLGAHLTRLEEALIDYLESRDARLEEERLRILADLVDELAEGLSRRERRRLAGRVDEVREQLGQRPSPPPADVPPELRPPVPRVGPEGGFLDELFGERDDDLDEEDGGAVGDVEGAGAPNTCPECGFVAKSAGGLASHLRAHG